jgi:hypothetical protein
MSETTTTPTLADARSADGFIPLSLDLVRRMELATSSAVEDEIFASLNFISDIKNVGLEFVTKLTGKTGEEADNAHQLFQAFVRQGQAFFQSAEKLHYRASPLFYYYSFLNFAKAYICLRRPEVFLQKVRHGVSHHYEPKKEFREQAVTTAREGVFPLFYELLLGGKIPALFRFNVSELLGYMSDIEFEYDQAGYGESRLLPVKSRGLIINVTDPSSEFWTVLAIGKFERLEKSGNALQAFHEHFEEVSFDKILCERFFDISAPARGAYRFFQSRNTTLIDDTGKPAGEIFGPARKALELVYMPSVLKSEYDFFLALPIADDLCLKFDELLAGYLLFFYLGDLVRYHPDYLENILFSRESWIIQRFTRSCATTVLRRMALLLLNENRVYYPR